MSSRMILLVLCLMCHEVQLRFGRIPVHAFLFCRSLPGKVVGASDSDHVVVFCRHRDIHVHSDGVASVALTGLDVGRDHSLSILHPNILDSAREVFPPSHRRIAELAPKRIHVDRDIPCLRRAKLLLLLLPVAP